jgi:predicted transposase YdaD
MRYVHRPMGAFDVTTKFLIENHTADWLALAGVPTRGLVPRVVDADLSTISSTPDKLIRLGLGRRGTAVHVEFQSARDADLDERVLAYNVLARRRHGVPVRSVVFLLRPEAGPPSVSSVIRWHGESSSPLSFDYDLIRVWELPPERLLAGGIGTLALAPIAAVPPSAVRGVIGRVRDRLDREVAPPLAAEVLHATRVLTGLRYTQAEVQTLFRGVRHMRESSYYQEILDEGRVEGRVEGRLVGEQDLLVQMGTQKFGRPPAGALARLRAVADTRELERLGVRLLTAESWNGWLGVTPAAAKPPRRRRTAR